MYGSSYVVQFFAVKSKRVFILRSINKNFLNKSEMTPSVKTHV